MQLHVLIHGLIVPFLFMWIQFFFYEKGVSQDTFSGFSVQIFLLRGPHNLFLMALRFLRCGSSALSFRLPFSFLLRCPSPFGFYSQNSTLGVRLPPEKEFGILKVHRAKIIPAPSDLILDPTQPQLCEVWKTPSHSNCSQIASLCISLSPVVSCRVLFSGPSATPLLPPGTERDTASLALGSFPSPALMLGFMKNPCASRFF